MEQEQKITDFRIANSTDQQKVTYHFLTEPSIIKLNELQTIKACSVQHAQKRLDFSVANQQIVKGYTPLLL